jgi:cellulose synthase/poly-beta-1,6-N-acetylglucosamine synthase-like glycosyltransferase
MAKTFFFVAAALLFYNYFLYPAIVIALARRKRTGSHAVAQPCNEDLPSVTLVIAAYNEERVIESKIQNSVALDYPRDKLRVLVVSDGSTDSTPGIAEGYARDGVISMHQPQRRGKTAALNRAVAEAKGDIVVFSDANNMFAPASLRELVKHFADPLVGGVCGLKQIYDSPDRESSQGDSLYWRYESAIKEAESTLNSITTADGEIFAIRRTLYEVIDEKVINDDAEITFSLVRRGYRVLYERNAKSFEHASIRIEDDFHVKVRMVSGGFQTLLRHRAFLLPPRSWFAVNFISHKLLRWLAPEFMLMIAVTSILLVDHPLFFAALLLQVAFYVLALAGWSRRNSRQLTALLYVPFYFCAMNLAALRGLLRFVAGNHSTLWRKAER